MFYFLAEDVRRLDEQIQKIQQLLDDALASIGQSVEGESNTWHDNFAFEEAQRESEMWSDKLRELLNMRREVIVVDPPNQTVEIEIGHIVIIKDFKDSQTRTVRMGSYMSFSDDSEVISYTSPMGKILMGAKVGEFKLGQINKEQRLFKVLEIKSTHQYERSEA